MTGLASASIGYIGVDVLNNATICNEATGLLEAEVPLDVVTVYRYDNATYYQNDSLAKLRESVWSIHPLSVVTLFRVFFVAPFLFGTRFWSMLAKAIFGPSEGWRQRCRLIYQTIPATVAALHWRDRNIKHVHAHWAHTATSVAMHAAELLGVGFSFTGHANDLFVHRVGLIAKIRRARFIVCISEFHRRFYIDLGADPAKLAVVYCGIDLKRFAAGSRETGESSRQILSVGRLVEKKGFADLIDACAVLRDRGAQFDCLIAGSGPQLNFLNQRIQELKLEDRVKVTGETVLQETLPHLLDSACLFALPCIRDSDGDMDGLPQVLIEAMLRGVPSISTRLVGIPDLVRDGETGLLVEPGDIDALADAIETMLFDPELAARLGHEGEAWAREHFGLDQAVARMAGLFEKAVNTPLDQPMNSLPIAAPGASNEYQSVRNLRPVSSSV